MPRPQCGALAESGGAQWACHGRRALARRACGELWPRVEPGARAAPGLQVVVVGNSLGGYNSLAAAKPRRPLQVRAGRVRAAPVRWG
jgi:hypothetical protein